MAVPQLGLADPARLFQAGQHQPMRVVVRNTGGNLVFLAHDVSDLSQVNSSAGSYALPAGEADVFVLAPGQSIIAAASGGGGQVSIAASDAIPIDKNYMES